MSADSEINVTKLKGPSSGLSFRDWEELDFEKVLARRARLYVRCKESVKEKGDSETR